MEYIDINACSALQCPGIYGNILISFVVFNTQLLQKAIPAPNVCLSVCLSRQGTSKDGHCCVGHTAPVL